MADYTNPFLRGYSGAQRDAERSTASQIGSLGGLLGIQNEMEMGPIKREMAQIQLQQARQGPQPKWQAVERFNPQTGQKEKVLVDMNNPSNVMPMGGQEAERITHLNAGSQFIPVGSTSGQIRGMPIPISQSTDSSARLAQADRHWSGLSAADAARIGISADEHFYNTGRTPLNMGPQQGAPLPSPQARPNAPVPPGMMGQEQLNATAAGMSGGGPSAVTNPALAQTQARVTSAETQPGGGGMLPSSAILPQQPGGAATVAGAGGRPIQPVITRVPPKEQNKLAVDQPAAQSAVSIAMQNLDRMDSMSAELIAHPGLTDITGKINQYSALDVFPQTRDARGISGSLTKQVGVAALQAMRDASKTGGAVGQVTEKEWPILQQSIAALDESQTTGAYQTALVNLQNQIRASKQRVREAYESTYGPLQYEAPKYQKQGQPLPASSGAGPAGLGNANMEIFKRADAIINGQR